MTTNKHTSKLITCRHCNNNSRFLILGETQHHFEEAEIDLNWKVLLCENCGEETIERQITDFGLASEEYDYERGTLVMKPDLSTRVIYPSDKINPITHEPRIDMERLAEIAPNVARAFEIAVNTISTEPVASAVFVRKTLECVYKDRAKALSFGGKEPRNLGGPDGKLKRLLDETVISQELYNIADRLKDIGNDIVHDEEINEVSLEDAIKLLDISEKVLKHIYQPLIDLKILEAI